MTTSHFNKTEYLKHIVSNDPDAIYEFSMPISVNAAYSNHAFQGRVKTRAYIKWLSTVKKEALTQKKIAFDGQIAVLLNLYVPPDKRPRDCANYEKVSTDFLVSSKIIIDDSKVRLNIQQWLDEEERKKQCVIYIYDVTHIYKRLMHINSSFT